jgi:hypothetical protein
MSLPVLTKRALHRAGIALPSHYVCIDIETTGLKFSKDADNNDLVVQVAWLECKDGGTIGRFARFCNWVLDGDPEQTEDIKHDLRLRLENVRASMREKGETYQVRLDDLLREEVSATDTLSEYIDDLLEFQRAGVPLCGLNITGFDLRVLAVAAHEWLNRDVKFDGDMIIDVGALYKIVYGPVSREYGESTRNYFVRAMKTRIPRTWNKRKLIDEYGIGASAEEWIPKLHLGDVDCEVIRLIMESIREAECDEPVRLWPGGRAKWDTQSISRD